MKKEELRTEIKKFAKNLIDGYVDNATVLELLGTEDVINDYIDNQLKKRWIEHIKKDHCDCGLKHERCKCKETCSECGGKINRI